MNVLFILKVYVIVIKYLNLVLHFYNIYSLIKKQSVNHLMINLMYYVV